jgi:CRP-like cAMP-binding protein
LLETSIAAQINWPTKLSDTIKHKLIEIAQYKTDFNTAGLDRCRIASRGVCYVISGTAAIYMQTPNLKTVNSIVIGKQQWFGNYQDEKNNLLSFFVAEVKPLDLVFFQSEDIQRLMSSDLEVFKWLYHVANQLQAKCLQSQLVTTENKETRVVYLLIELAVHQQRLQGAIPKIEVSQQQLSIITGIARQRVNEVLKKLEEVDFIRLERNCIHLLDLKGLGAMLHHIDLSIRDPRLSLAH